jgi:Rho GDP-dissociation inhibitor
MSSAVEAAIPCSKVVDIAAAGQEEAAKERALAAVEHGNGDCAEAATNGKKCAEAASHCRKAEEDDDEEDGEKVPEHIDLGPILSIKDQLEKDKVCTRHRLNCFFADAAVSPSIDASTSSSFLSQDDESLRRWKEQLLGSVDLNSVGGKPKPLQTQVQFP